MIYRLVRADDSRLHLVVDDTNTTVATAVTELDTETLPAEGEIVAGRFRIGPIPEEMH